MQLMAAETNIVRAGSSQLAQPIRRRTARLTMSPQGYYHLFLPRNKFDVLGLFRVHHIIAQINQRPLLIEDCLWVTQNPTCLSVSG